MAMHSLSITQRNLYIFFLSHKERYKHSPCFIPKVPMSGNRLSDYLRAIEALEEKGLIIVHRSEGHYTSWIMDHGKNSFNKTQQGLTGSWK